MKILSNGDAYADALSTAAIATVPFVAFGMLDRPVVLNTALTIGILIFCIYLARVYYILKHDSSKKPEWLPDLMSMLQVPYVFLVATLLLYVDHIDATPIVWVCIATAVLLTILLPFFRDDGSL